MSAVLLTARCVACRHRIAAGNVHEIPTCPKCSSPMVIVNAERKP
jgi:Zn finger protein HypA/HybF involved in hydrogenase expression